MQNDEKFALAAVAVAVAIALVIMLAINALVCWLTSSTLARIPAGHRKMDPGLVWLLMIPCFPVVWNFFVFQRIPESFASHFASVGRTDVGDCGKQLGLWYAICTAAAAVPVVNYIAGPASLILLVLVLVKFNELKGKLDAA